MKLIIGHKMNLPRADIGRLYVKREIGGRGLIQPELADKTTTNGLKKYY